MPVWPGNKYSLVWGRQTVKGTPATTGSIRTAVTGGGFTPRRDILQLAETDSSRQAGKSMVVGAHVEGNPSFYVRPSEVDFFMHGVLGTNVDSGTTPNYTHIQTLADTVPYYTVWETYGGVIISKYVDVKLTGTTLSGAAGQALSCQLNAFGLSAVFGATDDPAVLATEDPLVYPQVLVTKNALTPRTVDSWSFTIANNGGPIQSDNGLVPFDYIVGKLDVSGTISILAQDDTDFRKFHTGTTGGTAFGQVLDLESLTVLAQVNANLSLQVDVANAEYTDYPIAPNTDGSPVKVAMGFRSRRDDVTVGNYFKTTVKNQKAAT